MKYALLRPHLALLGANILFGLNYSYSKQLLPHYLSPSALSLLRVLFASCTFLLLLGITKRFRVEKRDILRLVIAGLLGVVGNQLFFLKGLALTSPVDAAIITTIGPILVMLLSALFYKEKITLIRGIGMTLGLGGALLVITSAGISAIGATGLWGSLLVLCSVLSYSSYLVWAKPLLARYDPMTVMGWIFTSGAVLMSLFLLPELGKVNFEDFDASAFFAFGFVLIGATVLPYLFVAIGLQKTKPTIAGIYSYIQPIVASLYACLLGIDRMTPIKLIAAMLVLSGVFMVSQGDALLGKKIKI